MGLITDIEQTKPKRFKKPNHFKIFLLIAEMFDIVLSDVNQIIRNFFPYLASSVYLPTHAKGMGIYQFNIESEDDLRARVSTAYNYLSRIGERSLLIEYLDFYFPGRYELRIYPKRSFRIGYSKIGINSTIGIERACIVHIHELTETEKTLLSQFLEEFLDPDVLFNVREESI